MKDNSLKAENYLQTLTPPTLKVSRNILLSKHHIKIVGETKVPPTTLLFTMPIIQPLAF